MLKLNDLLKTEDQVTNVQSVRVYNPLYFSNGSYFLSIQASYGHYCTPRKTVDISEYSAFEVLVSLKYEDIPKKWLEEYNDGSNTLFSNVPREEVEQLVNQLDEKYGLD